MSGSDLCYDVVIAGAGLAGAATAWMAARAGGRRILLVEQESELGRHSSGRSAAIVRRATGDARLDALCDEGAAFLAAPPRDFVGATGFRRTGGWLVAHRGQGERWRRRGVERAAVGDFARALPDYQLPDDAELLHAPDDGVADPLLLLAGFVASAEACGVEVARGAPIRAVEVVDGEVRSVRVGSRRLACGALVDACGAWSPTFAARLRAAPDGMRTMRRHLLQTAPLASVDPAAPWVWDHARDFYARPEAGGLLLCACDEAEDAPGDCQPEPAVEARIRAKLAQAWPRAASAATARFWAGHRTRRDDEQFVLGRDARVRGLLRAAGLGGHGVTAAAAVGAAVARALAER
ncbi:MAG: FAD-binding oxidoreductase [Planctomycetes bacterium]|nr:FAD-binding oxidoreductase [Planctomycetota bacterium]